jgi:integrase
MPPSSRRSRFRGTVDQLPSGAFRVRVYAGSDPLTGKRHDLTEVVPPGPRAAAEAEKVRARLLNQVDEQRNPRTKATVNQLLDRYLAVVELEESIPSGSALRRGRALCDRLVAPGA